MAKSIKVGIYCTCNEALAQLDDIAGQVEIGQLDITTPSNLYASFDLSGYEIRKDRKGIFLVIKLAEQWNESEIPQQDIWNSENTYSMHICFSDEVDPAWYLGDASIFADNGDLMLVDSVLEINTSYTDNQLQTITSLLSEETNIKDLNSYTMRVLANDISISKVVNCDDMPVRSAIRNCIESNPYPRVLSVMGHNRSQLLQLVTQ